jgi:Tol biopolymer transport system component
MLPGTERGRTPFWSPDSKYIGFFASGEVKRIDLSGGSPQTLCNAPGGWSGAWNRDGVILFGDTQRGGLYRLSGAWGEPKPLTELDRSRQEVYHWWPEFLPDGRHFLYYAISSRQGNAGIYIGSLDSKEKRQLLVSDSDARYSPAGYLLYVRGGTLMAQPFNAKRLEFTGDPVPVAEQVQGVPSWGFAAFSLSQNGVLAYRTGSGGSTELIWFDRHGNRAGKVGPPAEYSNPSLSPDGSRLAVGRMDPQAKTRDLWVFDLKRGTSSRLTFDPADDFNPVWSHDGSRIFFTSNRKGQRDIFEKSANGIGAETLVFESKQNKSVVDLVADGRYLVYDTGVSGATTELWILPLFGERKPFPFVQSKVSATHAQFSPNGHFIAYDSNETGRPEVYVQTFPEQRGKWQISTDGGAEPAWRHDGKELFYITDMKLMAVEVKTDGHSFEATVPKPLFDRPFPLAALGWNHYIVTPDGQRFLFNATAEEGESSMINVVVNWPAGLNK